MKVVINKCYGGFGLSPEATLKLRERGITDIRHIPRDHPELIRVVEEMGDAANGHHAKLCIIEIPDEVKYYIAEYAGMEHVAERHRTWD